VIKINSEMESYVLTEIDKAELGETVAENRLKRFFFRLKEFTVTVLETEYATQKDLKST
jgi:hypothetical protein